MMTEMTDKERTNRARLANDIRQGFLDDLTLYGATPAAAAKEIASQLGGSKENSRRWAVETVIGVFGLNAPKQQEIDVKATLANLTDDELKAMIGRLDAEIEEANP
jgi:hypothetical protein